ncbi:MAG TPA: hypothetical protein VFJ82_14265 [Longimicrobium sp.]|nr:hypothetical protein [Longimicrobium sp.]
MSITALDVAGLGGAGIDGGGIDGAGTDGDGTDGPGAPGEGLRGELLELVRRHFPRVDLEHQVHAHGRVLEQVLAALTGPGGVLPLAGEIHAAVRALRDEGVAPAASPGVPRGEADDALLVRRTLVAELDEKRQTLWRQDERLRAIGRALAEGLQGIEEAAARAAPRVAEALRDQLAFLVDRFSAPEVGLRAIDPDPAAPAGHDAGGDADETVLARGYRWTLEAAREVVVTPARVRRAAADAGGGSP